MMYSDIMNNEVLMSLRNAAFDAMHDFAKDINSTSIDIAELNRLNDVVVSRIDKYTTECKNYTFDMWLSMDNPMRVALADGVFPTLSFKIKGKKGAQTCEISDDTKVFNLRDFITYSVQDGKSVVANKAWSARLEEAHKTLCGFLVAEMHSEGLKAKFLTELDMSFQMKVGAINCGEADFKKRYTKGAIDRTLQALFDALLYEDETGGGKNKYVVKTSNRNAILYTYARMDNNTIGKILFKNNNRFMADITKEFSVIVRGSEHSFDGYPVVSNK